jgi:diguanylate cyclase (GGDEF)-like protein
MTADVAETARPLHEPSQSSASKWHVLIAEDDPSEREFLDFVLRDAGYKTCRAVDGQEALEFARQLGPFDLLLTDLVMPRLSGIELVQRLRQTDPRLKVLYFTGFGDRLFEEKVGLSENEAFLEKPSSIEELLAAVARLLSSHPQASERASNTMLPRLRVLLIDDAEDEADAAAHALRDAGYGVVSERVDTPEALRVALESQRWDLVIADYTMRYFSGTTALTLVRDWDPDVPFIVVSGAAGEDAAVISLKAGADHYIEKGNLTRLVAVVERALRGAAVRREHTRAGERLVYLAYHDALTDLPNRVLLLDRLEQAALTAHRGHASVALAVMDLDGFKEVNDTLGHYAGDQILQQVAARLRSVVRTVDTVARLGGDEFALILPSTDVNGAEQTARKVLRALERPFVVNGRALAVRASIGIARFPEDGSNAETLLQKADVAMYLAKDDVSGYAAYAPERDPHTHRRLALITELRQGIDHGQFFLEYQPILDLRTRVVVGVEALLRWSHPEQGRLLPEDFLEVAEQTGVVSLLTPFVLEQAIGDWYGDPNPAQTVAVNLSPRNLHHPQLPDRIDELLRARHTAPSSLMLEITENQIMSDPVRSMTCLTRLREMGVRLAIDDFGTGYSSLSYLRHLPVDQLKIDKSFVIGLTRGDDEVIVRSTVDLAHNLGLTVVAEGVENEAVCDRLLALGCDAAQGVFISEPRSATAMRAWIAQRQELL